MEQPTYEKNEWTCKKVKNGTDADQLQGAIIFSLRWGTFLEMQPQLIIH